MKLYNSCGVPESPVDSTEEDSDPSSDTDTSDIVMEQKVVRMRVERKRTSVNIYMATD